MSIFSQLIKTCVVFFLFLSCHNGSGRAQDGYYGENRTSDQQVRDHKKDGWVDSVYNSLSIDQRIGQLFMVAAYSGGENYNEHLITKLIQDNHVGGLIFMQGTPEAQAQQTNKYQSLSRVPLLIGMDAEWGLGMRLTGVQNFPRQMMLGGTRNYRLVYELGRHVAMQCRIMGVHINFAPDIDINNNPDNPVINFRSFGEDKVWVAHLGTAYMKGLQDNNVLACAKHFPGHGDVDVDSHLDLPVIKKTKSQLDTLELFPFKKLLDGGVASVMIAHLAIPHLESIPDMPATLSHNVITSLLKEEMNFQGLIITDALNMKGVTKFYPPGEVDLRAFLAGNDILLFSQDVSLAADKIKKAMADGAISEQRLEYSVKKVLSAKYDVGLHTLKTVPIDNLTERLNENVYSFKEKAAAESITLVRDESGLIPRMRDSKARIAYLAVNGNSSSFVEELIKAFPDIHVITAMTTVKDYDVVIVGVHDLSMYPGQMKNYGIKEASLRQLEAMGDADNVVVVLFGNAYAMKYLCQYKSVIVTYEEHASTFMAAVRVLAGDIKAQGVLPVTVCD